MKTNHLANIDMNQPLNTIGNLNRNKMVYLVNQSMVTQMQLEPREVRGKPPTKSIEPE